jgi:hypothetical protein
MFAEKEVFGGHRHDRAEGEQKSEGVRVNASEDRHALQEFDPSFLHDGSLPTTRFICNPGRA